MAFSAVDVRAGGGGSDGRSIRNKITQSGHDFSVGMTVYRDPVSGLFKKASASATSLANTCGIVESVSGNDFILVYQGEINFSTANISVIDNTGLTNGYVYYLADDIGLSGYLSPTEPTGSGSVIQPIFVATDVKRGIVINSLPDGGGGGGSIFTPIGSLAPFAGPATSIPDSWLLCQGSSLPRSSSTYSELYGVIGAKYSVQAVENTIGGASGGGVNDLTVSFQGDLTEAPTDNGLSSGIHNLTTAVINPNYKLSWSSSTTNYTTVAKLVDIDSTARTAKFRYLINYPSTPASATFFSTIVNNSVVKIGTFADGEITGLTSETFFIPDMRARTAVGVGAGTGLTASGYTRGYIGGEQNHLITIDELPAHRHEVPVSDNISTGSGYRMFPSSVGTPIADAATTRPTAFTDATGNNDDMNVVQPYVAVNWIIRYKRAIGAQYEYGPPGPAGPAGPIGPTTP